MLMLTRLLRRSCKLPSLLYPEYYTRTKKETIRIPRGSNTTLQMLDTFPQINNLNLDHVSEEGFASLRCNWMTCPRPQVEPKLGHDDGFWEYDGLYAAAWADFFPNVTIPKMVSGPCCAQFAVTRETVQSRTVDKYEQIRQWIWKQEAAELNMKTGIVLEYMWHVIFGKPAFFCPPARDCYCKKWGMCNLDCPDEGWCKGRIWLKDEPKNLPVSCLMCLTLLDCTARTSC